MRIWGEKISLIATLLLGVQSSVIADNLQLYTGWNLVGANSSLSLEALKGAIGEENLLMIQGSEKSYKKENVDNGTDFLNDFTQFEEGKGYWINVSTEAIVDFTPKNDTITIDLAEGWNLINPTAEMTLEQILAQVGEENLLAIAGIDKTYKKSYIDDGTDFLNDFRKFEEPQGYWVKVDYAVSLTTSVGDTSQVEDSFTPIKTLIQKAQEGVVQDVHYISVGDSTRAIDNYYKGGELYSSVSRALQEYSVTTTLQAKVGHTLRRWNDYDEKGVINDPTWETTIADISGDGNSTILNISLGVNDARYYGDGGEKERIVFHMIEAIDKVLAEKPETHIILTMPHRLVGMDTKTSEIKAAYEEVAIQRDLPLINTMDELFSAGVDMTLYRAEDAAEYGDNIRIHLSLAGQNLIADFILSKLIP